ncbi:hypothetical protein WJX73_004277 [Symbiochloris irregularis]|uniref:Uncharacterized protein n=1 Tax=Symbiochloris irregularis TaxID=706552 RepID=A0AAW1NLS7_9CHLO
MALDQLQYEKVDISDFDKRKEDISRQLSHAASTIGFFYVTGHGISEERLDRAFAIGKKWFDLALEQKAEYKLDPVEYIGWKDQGVSRKTARAPKEQITFGHVAPDNQYAIALEAKAKKVVPEIEEFTRGFMDDCLRISQTILRGLAIALGQDEDFFVKGLDRNLPDAGGQGGWNNYLPFSSSSPETKWRSPTHADAELFTLLFQQQGRPGLEVTPGREFFNASNNGKPFLKNWDKFTQPPDEVLTFHPMPPIKNAITVNIGDLLMRWSDGEYLSTYHRVRAPAPDNNIPEDAL